jgi:hypothetical protein
MAGVVRQRISSINPIMRCGVRPTLDGGSKRLLGQSEMESARGTMAYRGGSTQQRMLPRMKTARE